MSERTLKRRSCLPPVALAIAFSVVASAAFAQARPFTPRLSCSEAAAIVMARGGVVLSTGATTYDRYVRDRSFCQISEVLKPAFVATASNPQCFIGYTCVESSRDSILLR